MFLLLAIALSIDSLGIGISYGIRKVYMPPTAKLIISGISALVTCFSVTVGQFLSRLIPLNFSKILGVSLLTFMGIWIILQSFKKDEENTKFKKDDKIFNLMIKSLGITIQIIRNPLSCDFDESKRIDPLEAIYMGLALSVDSLGVGIGIATAGARTYFIPLATGLFQFIFLCLGGFLGGKFLMFKNINSKIWIIISGLILIILALLRCI